MDKTICRRLGHLATTGATDVEAGSVKRFLELLKQASRIRFEIGNLRKDLKVFAYLAAMLIKIEANIKQDLLETALLSHLLANC